MDYDELVKLLHYDGENNDIFMPNEIFNDLKNVLSNSSHLAFAYSYYYLISWLYRYAIYGNDIYTTDTIKEILGYYKNNKTVNYIIKKNGLLDNMGYTQLQSDYPVFWTFEDNELSFTMLSEYDIETQKLLKSKASRNYKIKVPLKGIYRTEEDINEGYESGTFYEIDNTHHIPFDVFLFCVSNENIGVIGFYLWSYLKMKNQIHSSGYDVSIDYLAKETGVKRSSTVKYLNVLKSHRMIICLHNQDYFVKGLSEDERKSSTYIVNDCSNFSDKPVEYEKMKVISYDDYIKSKNENYDDLI